MKLSTLAASMFLGTSLLSSAAFAHLSLKGEAMPITHTPYNWSGYYAGLNVGALHHTMNITDVDGEYFHATLQQVTNPKITGGLQVGYRRQLDLAQTSGVYGLEFSVNFANASFSKEYGSAFAPYQLNMKHELKNLCLLQLIGGIAADRTYLFLAAGLSWTNIAGNTTSLLGAPFINSFNVNDKSLGTALGAGAEYAINEKFSARLKVDVITPSTYSSTDSTGSSFQMANTIVQGTLGVNYKFA